MLVVTSVGAVITGRPGTTVTFVGHPSMMQVRIVGLRVWRFPQLRVFRITWFSRRRCCWVMMIVTVFHPL
jgi:hypothetical protein